MMTVRLGQGAHPVRKGQRIGEAREVEDPLQPSDAVAFDPAPVGDLAREFGDLGLRHSRRVAAAGDAAFGRQCPHCAHLPDTLRRLTSTNRSGRCCLAAFLMGWAVTAPPELSPADGDGPSPAWTVHPPRSVAPFTRGPRGGVLLRPRIRRDLARRDSMPRYLDLRDRLRTGGGLCKKRPAPAPTSCGGRRSPSALPGVI